MLSEYQLKIADLCNIPIGNVNNRFEEEMYLLLCKSLQLYLRLWIKLKAINCVLQFNQSQWLKQCIEFNTQKRIEGEQI